MATSGNSSEAITIDARAGAARAAEPTRRDGVRARPYAPRTVTTGGKNDQGDQHSAEALIGIDLDTGEPVALEASASRVMATRRLAPDTAIVAPVAQTDALAFSVVPPDDLSIGWVVEQMQRFLPIDNIEERSGCFGFKQSIRFGDGAGIVAWGGKSQRGRVYFSIQGKGCALVTDWAAVARWLEDNRATIKRVDVAYDDFAGATVSVAWAIEQYRAGGFTFGGRKPEHVCHGDWLAGERSAKGRTLQIGKRANGKLCRIYEKGKLKLTRFRGHLILEGKESADGKNQTAVRSGVQAADRRSGDGRAHAGRAVARVRSLRTEHHRLGRQGGR